MTKHEASDFRGEFEHSSAGKSRLDARYLAIRWEARVANEAKTKLLEEWGLELALLSSESPSLRVNQTEGLSWVAVGKRSLPHTELVARLEESPLVAWAAPAFRSVKSGSDKTPGVGLFTVNPTRLYVRSADLDRAGGVAALDAAITPSGSHNLRGYLTLRFENATFAASRTAIEAGELIERTLASASTRAPAPHAVRLETIPFLSPECPVVQCRPPVSEFVPDDPMFVQQWGLHRIGIPRAWQIARPSSSVTVAVMDEGVELAHPDLNVHPQSWNASSDTPDGGPTGSHGTACAGIIGARFDNGQGMAGTAPGVSVMAIATATWADVDIAEGLYFAADNGARVISMSFGVYPSWNVWDFDLIRDALQYCQDQGLVMIAASGNENGAEARFPGSDARTLCVGGSNRSDERKRIGDSSSETWWGASHGPDLDVVAPCLEIPTTDRLGNAGYASGDYFERFNGTSAATPHVAGLAALLLSMRPDLSNVEVRQIIESTCDKISPSTYAYTPVASKPNGTWNSEVGYGRVNAERALLAACALDDADERVGGCSGCAEGCKEEIPAACRAPDPVPWLTHDRCMLFYEGRLFSADRQLEQQNIQIRVTYQHSLCLLGKQQGPLLYTTTLLPGEELSLYEFDRYRRVREATERVSVHASFRQTLSALSQSRRSTSASSYVNILNEVRTHSDTSVSAGGELAGFFGAPQVSGEVSGDTLTSVASGASVRTASEQFAQLAVTASQALEAERSLVVSTFEEEEHRSTTVRLLRNENNCYAVTYFVRRVNEVYEMASRVESIEWRAGDAAFRSVRDLDGVPENVRRQLQELLKNAPFEGEMFRDPRRISMPTDGTLYEAELARCASCEPDLVARHRIEVERHRIEARRACLEVELLALEVERRRALASASRAEPLALSSWELSTRALPAPHPHGTRQLSAHVETNGHPANGAS